MESKAIIPNLTMVFKSKWSLIPNWMKGVCLDWPGLLWSNPTSRGLVHQALAGLTLLHCLPQYLICSLLEPVFICLQSCYRPTASSILINIIEGCFFNWWQGCCEFGKAEAVQTLLHHGCLLCLLHKVCHRCIRNRLWSHCFSGLLSTCSKSLCPSSMNG